MFVPLRPVSCTYIKFVYVEGRDWPFNTGGGDQENLGVVEICGLMRGLNFFSDPEDSEGDS